MPIHRRDFMKVLGISLASLLLSRCRSPFAPTPTCYAPMPPSATPPVTTTTSPAREQLRLYWLRFDELAKSSQNDTENKLGQELIAGHLSTLGELVASGEISAPVADLVQEAYEAAVYHVWRLNTPPACYDTDMTSYKIVSANVLVEQSHILSKVAAEGAVDPATLAKAQSALEQDMAFYALSDEEVQALYNELRKKNGLYQPLPSFEELSLELTPEAKEATQFIIDLLMTK